VADTISKTQRWLDLIAFLVGRRYPVEVEHIMDAVPAYAEKYQEGDKKARETVRRMFERDKDELRKLGIPIETLPKLVDYGAEEVQAYRIAGKDFYLPYLKLIGNAGPVSSAPTPGEELRHGSMELSIEDAAVACESLSTCYHMPSFPLKREASSALRKLSFDLGPHFEMGGSSPVLYVDRPGAEQIRSRVRVLSDALLARKRVRFTYHGIRRGEDTERDVAPYGLLFQRGHWYLIGHDETRDAERVFRVGRMEEPQLNTKSPKTADYEIPADFSLDEYRHRDAWELGSDDEETIEARVRFEFPTSLWAERNGYGVLNEELPDGSQVRTFEVRQVGPFLRWILSLEGRARIAAPRQLAGSLRSLAREVLAVYQASAAAAGTASAPGGAHE
jgi:proteasome accessory factor B